MKVRFFFIIFMIYYQYVHNLDSSPGSLSWTFCLVRTWCAAEKGSLFSCWKFLRPLTRGERPAGLIQIALLEEMFILDKNVPKISSY